jgi:hypothetical protein
MDYNEQVATDFYQTYAEYLAQAGLNGYKIALMMEQIKIWFSYGHKCGVRLLASGIQEYTGMLKKYARHLESCPQYSSFPAECTCGWEEIAKELNEN